MTTRSGSAKVAIPATLAVIGGAAVLFLLTFDRGGVSTPVAQAVPMPTRPAASGSATPPAQPPAPAGEAARVQGVVRWGRSEPVARPAGTIRLTDYNVENLFDGVDDPAISGPQDDAKMLKPDEACRAVAAAIRAVNPDILALQEIESEQALTWFRDTYLADMGYAHLVSIDAGDGRGIEQSVLSRFPVRDAANWPRKQLEGTHPDMWGNEKNEHAGEPIRFARSPLRVTIDLPAGEGKSVPLTLFVVHHKSGGPGGYQREAEAQGIIAIAGEFQKAHPDHAIAITGDFNARPSDQSVQLYLDAGWKDAFGDRVSGDPAWITHSSGRSIDYIMVNEHLSGWIVPETRFILGTPDRPAGMDWRNTPSPIGWASDHYPVTVDLRVK